MKPAYIIISNYLIEFNTEAFYPEHLAYYLSVSPSLWILNSLWLQISSVNTPYFLNFVCQCTKLSRLIYIYLFFFIKYQFSVDIRIRSEIYFFTVQMVLLIIVYNKLSFVFIFLYFIFRVVEWFGKIVLIITLRRGFGTTTVK